MNMICLGGRTIGSAIAWECTRAFLKAELDHTKQKQRRLFKILKEEGTVENR